MTEMGFVSRLNLSYHNKSNMAVMKIESLADFLSLTYTRFVYDAFYFTPEYWREIEELQMAIKGATDAMVGLPPISNTTDPDLLKIYCLNHERVYQACIVPQ